MNLGVIASVHYALKTKAAIPKDEACLTEVC